MEVSYLWHPWLTGSYHPRHRGTVGEAYERAAHRLSWEARDPDGMRARPDEAAAARLGLGRIVTSRHR